MSDMVLDAIEIEEWNAIPRYQKVIFVIACAIVAFPMVLLLFIAQN